MWITLLDRVLRNVFRMGQLTVTWPDGRVSRYGGAPGPSVAVSVLDPHLPRRLVMTPELALGEGYMEGGLTVAQDDLMGFLTLAARNSRAHGRGRWAAAASGARTGLRRLAQRSPLHVARRNVAHHYDLSTRLYELFLCDDLQYTCAYFADPGMSLEQAQAAKKAHIAAKLRLRPGMRVLDVGCGWGGTALSLARDHGVHVTAVTLSEVQLDYARARAEAAGVADRIDFRLMDYRDLREQFDRIVVVGMMEHVGQPQYGAFMEQLHDCLSADGIALVHTIGRATPPGRTSPFIHKYIFPGGYIPAMSEVMTEVERAGLVACDVEVWRGHYERTLAEWRARFEENLDQIRALYDEEFCRMWRYYLSAAEVSKRELGLGVFQFQLARHAGAVPMTREYLHRVDDVPEVRMVG